MKILLVEDHTGLAQISCRLLRDVYDHEVEHAASGSRVLDTMARFHPDLVLLDINLPDIKGDELARQIRAQPIYDSTILVALTGFGTLIDETVTRAAGFDARFNKPMNFDVLPSLKRAPASPVV